MANETTVGGIVGWLRLENDQFVRAINQAIAKSEQLDGKQVDVQVDAHTAKANAQLAATEKQVDKLDRANARVNTSSRNAGRGMGALATAVIGLGPALVPVAAGATALGVAFGGMATAGVLAVVGIAKEMQEGTAVGLTYRGALQGAKGDLTDLGRVAARNVLKPFLDIVADLNSRMPALRGQIGDLATVTGSTAAALAGGLLNAFQALEPLMRDASVYVLGMSRAFQSAMSGPGIVAFGDYVRSVFPQVLDALGSIIAAAGHLVTSLAPLGLGVLTGLQLLSDLIRQIPVDVLANLAQVAGSVFLGFKAWQGLHAIVGGFGAALERVGVQAATAATAMRGLNIAAGVIGVALAAFSFVVSRNADAARENEQAVNDLTDALIASNGVLDEHVRRVQFDALASSGAIDTYKALGGNVRDLVDASLGLVSGQQAVNDVLARAKPVALDFGAAGVEVNGQIVALTDATDLVASSVGIAAGRFKDGKQAQADYAAATSVAAAATSDAAIAAQYAADQYGTSAAVYSQVATSQQGIADKAAAATLQMQLENDAAGLLKQSLDLLNGKTLDLTSAQTSSASATLRVKDALDKSSGSLSLNSQRGVEARQSIEAKARADQALAEATATATGSTKAGTKSLADSKAQLEKTLKSQGLLTDKVQAYIDKLYQVPKKIPPTKLEVDKAAAEAALSSFKTALSKLNGKTVTTYIRTVKTVTELNDAGYGGVGGVSQHGMLRRASGGPIPGYAGGTLIGPGTGVSDSIAAMVAQTGRIIRVSAGEFVSTDASRRRNLPALEAGNRGATLGVVGQSIDYTRLGQAVVTALQVAGLASALSSLPSETGAAVRDGMRDASRASLRDTRARLV